MSNLKLNAARTALAGQPGFSKLRPLKLAFGAMFGALVLAAASPAPGKPKSSVELWRLDCGRFDVKNIGGRPRVLSNGCYLIRHGSDYMIWDVGLEDSLIGKPDVSESQTLSLDRTILSQLEQIGVKPSKIRRIGVSHYHGDHFGQAERFPSAFLLIGREDWSEIRKDKESAALLDPWIEGKLPVVQVDGDFDVFGDGRVVMIATPGHTPGHKSLLVRLKSGAVLLTGDAVHSHDQLATKRSSGNHVDKVLGVSSIERMLRIEREVPARVIVQHDPADIPALPAFPASLN